MKKGARKRQQKDLRKRAQDRLAQRHARAVELPTALRHIRQARQYPIEGCWVQKDWREGGLAVVVIARRQPDGNLLFGNYLVDYYCLGLKNTFCHADVPPRQFHREHLPKFYRTAETPTSISPALAHEIIYGSIEYAARFGFRPQRDFKDSQYVLDSRDTHPRSGTVEFGRDGKPLYISGPHDNADAIMQQLRRTAGDGNFDYLVKLGGPPDDF